jgi:hypothetical protein
MRHRQRATAGESRRKPQLPVTRIVLMARHEGPAGVRERGIGARGLPRNLGDLVVSGDVGNGGAGTAERRDDRREAGRAARSRSSE